MRKKGRKSAIFCRERSRPFPTGRCADSDIFRRAGACPRRDVPESPIRCSVGADSIRPRDVPELPIRCVVGNGLDRSEAFSRVSFSPAGAASRPGYPGGIRRLVHPSGGRFYIRPWDTVSFFCAGAASRPGWPGGICRLVRPSGGRFFPLVRKESEERHANGKGFAQRRPSLWIPILRNLRAVFALKITVRVPGLRPCRAFVICTGNRGGGKPPPYGGCSNKRTNPQGRILYPPVGTTRNFASARRERS